MLRCAPCANSSSSPSTCSSRSRSCPAQVLYAPSPQSLSPRRKPGPKGPSTELIAAIIELKSRNPKFGCVRIAQQLSHVFGIEIDKDVVRRVLAKHYRPTDTGANGPSWLTFIAQTKDSLWSLDLFRCE